MADHKLVLDERQDRRENHAYAEVHEPDNPEKKKK
jgi:hypothetical protein